MTRESNRLPIEQPLSGATYSAVEINGDGTAVWMLEQRDLPLVERYLELTRPEEVAWGIRDMVVRGAPAIGIAAAYGMTIASLRARGAQASYLEQMRAAARQIGSARPTAVNLAWAVEQCVRLAEAHAGETAELRHAQMLELALRIHRDDVAACRRMGELGAAFVPDGATILTHCNAGALATGGYGTALGVVRAARDQGKTVRVLADETRPYLQGVRLTAWELHKDGIPVEVITDNMAGYYFGAGVISLAVVGADRIARNGDVANKIGTYSVACLAEVHGRPMFVAAPWSTVDMSCPDGSAIPIEERASSEVTVIAGRAFAPDGVSARYPGFDVTPARLVSAIFTERGVVRPVTSEGLNALANGSLSKG